MLQILIQERFVVLKEPAPNQRLKVRHFQNAKYPEESAELTRVFQERKNHSSNAVSAATFVVFKKLLREQIIFGYGSWLF